MSISGIAASAAEESGAESFRLYWRHLINRSDAWSGEELLAVLCQNFVHAIIYEDADDFAALGDSPRLYLANHQVAIESVLFIWALSAITGTLVRTIAKDAHRTNWLGEWMGLTFQYPAIRPPEISLYRDEYNAASLIEMRDELDATLTRDGHALLVHTAALRALRCRVPLTVLSRFFIDMALRLDVPIVPVRFAGGLPVETMDDFRNFPIGFTGQDYYLGRAVMPDQLRQMQRDERTRLVLARINNLGPNLAEEVPNPPKDALRRRVQDWMSEVGTTQFKAFCLSALEAYPQPCAMTRRLLAALESGALAIGDSDEERWFEQWARWLTDSRLTIRSTPQTPTAD